jgi:hypothetical protein
VAGYNLKNSNSGRILYVIRKYRATKIHQAHIIDSFGIDGDSSFETYLLLGGNKKHATP